MKISIRVSTIEVVAWMPPPKRNLQTLNLPFKAKLFMTDRCRPYGRICFVLLVFLFLPGLTGAKAQTHPDVKDSSISPAARGDFYFSQGKFKESLEIYKTVVQEGTDSSYIFRNMVRAWNAMASLDEAEKYLSEYRDSHENSSAVWYALGYLHYLMDDEQGVNWVLAWLRHT